ncbi:MULTISPECIES: hypothetical protein [unclassified Campylobacter]|uniref:hypothetical protein n=1 Tax=unclassified Campylobacter TaxID=2593542 RepID=UPI00168016F4|nr:MULTISPECIES: hypothetical protein [unclassified Campylobacter]
MGFKVIIKEKNVYIKFFSTYNSYFIACSKEDTSISNNNITSPNVVAQDFI